MNPFLQPEPQEPTVPMKTRDKMHTTSTNVEPPPTTAANVATALPEQLYLHDRGAAASSGDSGNYTNIVPPPQLQMITPNVEPQPKADTNATSVRLQARPVHGPPAAEMPPTRLCQGKAASQMPRPTQGPLGPPRRSPVGPPFPPARTFTNVEPVDEIWRWPQILARAQERFRTNPMKMKIANEALKFIRYMHEFPIQGWPTHTEVPIVLNAPFIEVKEAIRGAGNDFWFDESSTNVEFDWCQWVARCQGLGEHFVGPGIVAVSVVAHMDSCDDYRANPESCLNNNGRGPPEGCTPRMWEFKFTRIDGQVFFVKPFKTRPPVVTIAEVIPKAMASFRRVGQATSPATDIPPCRLVRPRK